LHLIPYQLLADKTFIINAIQDYPRILEWVPMSIKSDREFMLQVIEKTNGWTLRIVAQELEYDLQFIVEAAKLNFEILEWLPFHYKYDKELFEMLKKEGIKTEKALIEVDKF
jgi:CO dehydrogenase/acetyl-CoA synthase delta subunit